MEDNLLQDFSLFYITKNNAERNVLLMQVQANKRLGSVTTVEFKLNPNAQEWTPISSKIGIEGDCVTENKFKF